SAPLLVTATSPRAPYTPSLHDALPISLLLIGLAGDLPGHRRWQDDHALGVANDHVAGDDGRAAAGDRHVDVDRMVEDRAHVGRRDRKSTRLNSSHVKISYAVFCLKKKK